MLKIQGRGQQPLRVVREHAKAEIARPTEEAADKSRIVIVVDIRGRLEPATSTQSTLRFRERIEPFRRQAVSPLPPVAGCLASEKYADFSRRLDLGFPSGVVLTPFLWREKFPFAEVFVRQVYCPPSTPGQSWAIHQKCEQSAPAKSPQTNGNGGHAALHVQTERESVGVPRERFQPSRIAKLTIRNRSQPAQIQYDVT